MGYEVNTLRQFLQRVASVYLVNGYVRYALREIPGEKDPLGVERKLLDSYGIVRCRTTRMRRRAKGLASVGYVRLGHTFVLLATEGEHPTFDRIRSYDFRTTPLHIRGYSVGVRRGKPCIEVSRQVWVEVERRFERIGLHDLVVLEKKLGALPYYHFPGVLQQKRSLVAAINRRRKRSGLPQVSLFESQFF